MTVTPEVVFAAVGFLLIPGLRPTNRAANTDGLLESLSQSFTSDSDVLFSCLFPPSLVFYLLLQVLNGRRHQRTHLLVMSDVFLQEP